MNCFYHPSFNPSLLMLPYIIIPQYHPEIEHRIFMLQSIHVHRGNSVHQIVGFASRFDQAAASALCMAYSRAAVTLITR